jgi:hypothetical protein
VLHSELHRTHDKIDCRCCIVALRFGQFRVCYILINFIMTSRTLNLMCMALKGNTSISTQYGHNAKHSHNIITVNEQANDIITINEEPNNKNINLNDSVNNANESFLNELDNYTFDLDINNINEFVLLEDRIDINTIYGTKTNLNNINNGIGNNTNNNIITSNINNINVPLPSFSEADKDIIVRESDINVNIENIDELVVLEDKIDHNIIINTTSETEMNININNAIDNNNNIISGVDINVPFSEADEDLIVGVSGKKK